MEAIAIPLRRLHEEAAWFARAAELRLLHVTADATLRGPALEVLMAQELHADNRALFFRFDDPVTGAARGWPERAARLRQQVAEKTEALAPAGIHLPPLPDAAVTAAAAGRGPAAELAAILFEARGVLVPPLAQIVVVMAPVRVDDGALFADEMASLVGARELGHVRWIVVETDGAALAPLARELGAAALQCACAVDAAAQEDALAALGAVPAAQAPAGAGAPPGTTTRGPRWRAPGAGPAVPAPARAGDAPAARDAEVHAAGLTPAFVDGGGDALKRLVLGAALAMRNAKPVDAITLQARAAALCAEMGMADAQVLNLHVLAGYLVAAAQGARARDVYRQAGEIARAHGHKDLEAQSELALGMLEAVDRVPTKAAAHYAAAARLAEEAKIEALAIEAWRMAGQLASEARLEASAVECWQRALDLAAALEPQAAQATSAAEIARALAALHRRRGQLAQAQALEERGAAIEEGTPRA
jgi:hypothetical protein